MTRTMIRRCCVVSAACLGLAGCFELLVPEGAQVTCSEHNPTCPEGLQCCEGRICQRHCACEDGAEPCGLNGAVDCAGLRQCADHCWAACPSCAERCANPQLKTCQAEEFDEVWFCAGDDVCVVKHGPSGTTPTAACHPPPPQCADPGDQVCACLQAAFSISPPCAPFEHCSDYAQPCVACRQEPSSDLDSGVTDRNGAGLDAGLLETGAGPLDAGTGGADAPAIGLDASASSDAPAPEDPVSLGATAPACYTAPGGGTLCCALVDTAASFSDQSGTYACQPGSVLATECTAFDESCAEASSLCNASDPCRWAYCSAGTIRCTDDGPPAPCNGTSWDCPAGSVVLSTCGGACMP